MLQNVSTEPNARSAPFHFVASLTGSQTYACGPTTARWLLIVSFSIVFKGKGICGTFVHRLALAPGGTEKGTRQHARGSVRAEGGRYIRITIRCVVVRDRRLRAVVFG